MNLQKRLIVSFLVMILMPIFLATASIFGLMRFYTSNLEQKYRIEPSEYVFLGNSIQLPDQYSKSVYEEMVRVMKEDPERLTDRQYLQETNEKLVYKNAFILVRDGNRVLYNGAEHDVDLLLSHLPKYGPLQADANLGLYISGGLDVLVRQLDFSNSRVEKGSIFLVTPTQTPSPEVRNLGFQIVMSIVLVLIFTSLFLTWWIYKGIVTPLQKLKEATQRIKEGDLDFTLDYDSGDEIGELFSNFEDMRARLKASTAEKLESDKENKELISNISHDLKTPITAVKGYVEGIMDGVADTPEKMDKYIRTIYNKANEMDALINELTLYCKIDTNRIPYTFNKINVSDVIRGEFEIMENDQDIVIMKSDGLPTYHFAHVVDDHFMRTTTVIRGAEWIASLPIHVDLFNAMGWKAPKYAHLPVIMKLDENGNRRKLSKRLDNEAAVSYFLEDGYPTNALIM